MWMILASPVRNPVHICDQHLAISLIPNLWWLWYVISQFLRAYFVIQLALFKLSDEISRIVFAIRRFIFYHIFIQTGSFYTSMRSYKCPPNITYLILSVLQYLSMTPDCQIPTVRYNEENMLWQSFTLPWGLKVTPEFWYRYKTLRFLKKNSNKKTQFLLGLHFCWLTRNLLQNIYKLKDQTLWKNKRNWTNTDW